jgi:hypothetical protein
MCPFHLLPCSSSSGSQAILGTPIPMSLITAVSQDVVHYYHRTRTQASS